LKDYRISWEDYEFLGIGKKTFFMIRSMKSYGENRNDKDFKVCVHMQISRSLCVNGSVWLGPFPVQEHFNN